MSYRTRSFMQQAPLLPDLHPHAALERNHRDETFREPAARIDMYSNEAFAAAAPCCTHLRKVVWRAGLFGGVAQSAAVQFRVVRGITGPNVVAALGAWSWRQG
jgi:hypothetical protein